MKYFNNFNEMYNNNTNNIYAINNSITTYKLTDYEHGRSINDGYTIIDDISGEDIFWIDSSQNGLKIDGDVGTLANYIQDNIRSADNEDDPVLLSGLCESFLEDFFENSVGFNTNYKITSYINGSFELTSDALPQEKVDELVNGLNMWVKDAYNYW